MEKLTEEERKKRNSERHKRWIEEKRLNGTLDSYNKERYAKNKEYIKKKSKEHYRNNKESILRENKDYRRTKEGSINYLYKSAKNRSKKYNILFNIELDDIVIPNVCPVLGIQLIQGDGVSFDGSPTLDRIIPELGYTKGNIIVVSMKANRIKNNATLEELKKVYEYYGKLL
jgi:hypothetical protein